MRYRRHPDRADPTDDRGHLRPDHRRGSQGTASMRARRIKAIAVKEILQVRRDPISLMIALLMPFMQMILLGYGVSLDVKRLPVCVFDREASQNSQALLKRFQASEYFSVVAGFDNYRDVTQALDRGQCRLVLVVPQDFTERLNDVGTSTVQALVDATDTNTANIAIGYAQVVVLGFSNDVQLEAADRTGGSAGMLQPVVVQ